MKRGDLLGGRFEIGEAVREGGMGVVFRAVDRRSGRVVALKALLDPSPAYAERFAREAALLARLRNDAVVGYVAHGHTDSGEPFLAMDWLEGEDLGDRLARGPLAVAEARALAVRLADALGAAHALGIVHRDVKPANVVLRGGDVARGTLIDFGAALSSEGPRRTLTGHVIGTPGYMAPEQARASRTIDARVDVYALGCVLFECLTGRPPFLGEHPVGVLAKVLLEDAPRLRDLLPGVPADLDGLVASMLTKDPAGRPADGAAVARALRGAAQGVAGPPASAVSEAITDDERVVVHVVLAVRARGAADPLGHTQAGGGAFDASGVERRWGVRVESLADGSLIASVTPGSLGPKGGAMRAAAVARELARALGSSAALASGLERMAHGLPLGEVVDRAVDLARRAMSAGVAGVVTDDVTAELLRGAWAVREHAGLRVLEDAPAGPAEARRIVGRDREIATLAAVFDEIERDGTSRVATVTAPPGGGKTRLLAEVVDRVAERATVHVVRCDETTAQSPLAAAAELARRVCDVPAGGSAEQRHAALAAFVAATDLDDAAKRRAVDFGGELVGATSAPSLAVLAARSDAVTMSDQMTRAFVDLLRARCASRPLVLGFDDLQWCDRASLRLLEAAARDLEREPLLVLSAARPEVDDVFPTAFAGRVLTRLSMAPLGRRAAEALVKDVAGDGAPGAVVDEIVTRGEGNPFLLEELARGAREGRAKGALGGTTTIVASRFESLSGEARRLLRAASIVGQRPPPAAVAALVGSEAGAPWLDRAWTELERAEVLLRREDGLEFRHALLRAAAYATLTERDRRLGHQLAARFFEAEGADATTVAAHADLGGVPEIAARAYVGAARAALDASDFTDAAAHAAAAVRAGARGELLGRAERLWTESAFWRGELREVVEHGARALELLDLASSDFFAASGYLIAAYSRLGQGEPALEHTRRILVARAPEQAAPARIAALLTAAGFLPLQGQLDLARAILREAKPVVEACAATSPVLPARYSRSRSMCAMAAGDLGAYLTSAGEAADRFAAIGDRRNELAQRGNVAYALVEVGDYAAAVREGRDVIEGAERMGLRSVVALAKQNVGYALVRSGEDAEGVATLQESLVEFESQGHARMAGGTCIYLTVAHLLGGRRAAAREQADRALELLATTPPLRAFALALASRLALDRGDVAGAKTTAEEALAILDSLGGIDAGETEVFLAVARARIAAGEVPGGRAALRRGRDRVRARASRLDDARRETFLGAVPPNVALLGLAADELGDDDAS